MSQPAELLPVRRRVLRIQAVATLETTKQICLTRELNRPTLPL